MLCSFYQRNYTFLILLPQQLSKMKKKIVWTSDRDMLLLKDLDRKTGCYMLKLKYIIHILSGVRFNKIKECLDRSHEISGKNRFWMVFDMGWCALRYGAGYYDYMMYGFFDRTARERDTYLTRLRNKKLISYLNEDEYNHCTNNKNDFNILFKEYLHRDVLDGRNATFEEFEIFMSDKDACFAKPEEGSSGHGVEKLYKKDFESLKAMFNYIQSKGNCAIEQCVEQHTTMSRLYPHSVNCMRIVTDLAGDEVHIAYVVLKTGNNGSVCDNSGQGGLICAVDKEKGIVTGIASDDCIAHYYVKHPYTGVTFDGFQIPLFKEAIAMCKEAAHVVPQIRHIGWDVAITLTGPVLIEGNSFPGTDLCQLYWNTPGRKGLMPFYRRILPELKF